MYSYCLTLSLRDALPISFQLLVSTLLLLMLGSWLVRSGRMRNAASHRGFYKALMCVGIGAGLPMVLGSVAVNAHPAAFSVRMLDMTYMSLLHLGQPLMAAGDRKSTRLNSSH